MEGGVKRKKSLKKAHRPDSPSKKNLSSFKAKGLKTENTPNNKLLALNIKTTSSKIINQERQKSIKVVAEATKDDDLGKITDDEIKENSVSPGHSNVASSLSIESRP